MEFNISIVKLQLGQEDSWSHFSLLLVTPLCRCFTIMGVWNWRGILAIRVGEYESGKKLNRHLIVQFKINTFATSLENAFFSSRRIENVLLYHCKWLLMLHEDYRQIKTIISAVKTRTTAVDMILYKISIQISDVVDRVPSGDLRQSAFTFISLWTLNKSHIMGYMYIMYFSGHSRRYYILRCIV